jgi:hypothetical protein
MAKKGKSSDPVANQTVGAADPDRTKSLEQLAAEQGVRPVVRVEELMGHGAELWADDAEFERFMTWLRECRRLGA